MLVELAYAWRKAVYRAAPFARPKLTSLKQHAPRTLHLPTHRPAPAGNCPTFSIVTPSYQQAAFIERTILSVSSQGYPAIEHIVIDGNSSDGTREILQRHENRLAHWRSEPDFGQSHAINKGFQLSTGEIMAYLNSDDIYLPGTVSAVAEVFAKDPELDAVYGHRIIIDEEDLEVGRWIVPAHDPEVLQWVDWVPQETLFWRRRAWERIGGHVDEALKFAMDWDLLLRFDRVGLKIKRLNRFLGGFRLHAQQKTLAAMSLTGEREIGMIRKRNLGRDVEEREIRRRVLPYLVRHSMLDLAWRLGFVDLET
jgi:glycosyltransferase involved in cell wall biosynthesis